MGQDQLADYWIMWDQSIAYLERRVPRDLRLGLYFVGLGVVSGVVTVWRGAFAGSVFDQVFVGLCIVGQFALAGCMFYTAWRSWRGARRLKRELQEMKEALAPAHADDAAQ